MKQSSYCSVFHYLRSNALLLISTLAALCLFLTISKLSILLCGAVFAAVAFTCWIEGPPTSQPCQPAAVILTLVMEGIAGSTFLHTWRESYMAGVIAEKLPFSLESVLLPCCCLGIVCSVLAFYQLSLWMNRVLLKLLKADGAVLSLARLKENWLFMLSALVFFSLEKNPAPEYPGAAALACAIMLIISLSIPGIFSPLSGRKIPMNIVSILTAAGICLFRAEAAAEALSAAAIVKAIAAFPFVLVCITVFFRQLLDVLHKLGTFNRVSRREVIVYGAILVLTLVAIGFVYVNTGVFSLPDYAYDIVYTGDFPVLVNGDVSLSLVHHENDLRQPLFALFSAPFTAIPWLISRILGCSAPVHAWLMNTVQIAVLLFTHFLLANMLGLSGGKRMAFVLLLCCSYPSLLFSLMMEQYIFAYFYVILFFSTFCSRGTGDSLSFCGAGGTMLTSVILLPLTSGRHPIREFRPWFREMLDNAMIFILAMAAFGRSDIITGVADHIINLNQFSGISLSFAEKCRQFTTFPAACFVAPSAEITQNLWDMISWQMVPASKIHPAGTLILVLCAISALLNRKKKSSLAAAGWICFSFAILVILGWGTAENGLILYSLYFGWAYQTLFWQLTEHITSRLKLPLAGKTATTLFTILLLLCNIPAMLLLSDFIITHYPL